MFLLPDWAPNAHPLVLHFPIALLVVAALFDLIGLLAGDRGPWRKSANWLYVLGGVAAVATFLTGRAAADSVFLPTEANALLTEHADLGKWTMWFFSGYGLIRLGLSATRFAASIGARALTFLVGAAGVGLLTVTATHGAELVYRHGVGVEAVETRPTQVVIEGDAGTSGVAVSDLGWAWTPARAAAWKLEAEFLEGSPEAVHSSLVDGGQRGDVIALETSEPALFVFPTVIDRLQIDLSLDLSDFDGSVYVAHHVQSDGSFGFTSFGDGSVRLGKTENNDLLVLSTESFDGSTWRDIRVVADGEHFRSYVDTRLVIHGHSGAFKPGRVGLRLNGTGTVRIARMQAVDIRKAGAEADDHSESTEGADHEHQAAPAATVPPAEEHQPEEAADSTAHKHLP